MSKRKACDDSGEAIDHDLGDGKTWFRGPMVGKGGFGSVYMATQKKFRTRLVDGLPAVMAVKSAEFSVAATVLSERFVLEKLGECQGIVRFFGEEVTRRQDGHMVYNLLLEYASAGTVRDRIRKLDHKGLPQMEVRRYTRSILLGIQNLHRLAGVVHCDLKPANILLVPNSEGNFDAKICDFGLARKIGASKRKGTKRTLRGTRVYLSPEALSGCEQEEPSDIWALGCTVLEMLTGQRLWCGKEGHRYLSSIQNGGWLPPKIEKISAMAMDFMSCCLQHRVQERWSAEMLLRHPFAKQC